MNRWPNKDPSDNRQYGIDFGPDLTAVDGTLSGTLSGATWVIPAGLTKGAEGVIGNVAVVRLSGGTDGVTYQCSCTATTSIGDTIERSGLLFVTQR